ncbi:MAG: hypothetical protein WAW96_14975 [Alphaproteobacteria bacterium]
MTEARLSSGFARLRTVLLATASAAALAMTAASAVAAPPAANSLPGAFSASQPATYTGGPNLATITTGAGNAVLQWGGTPLANAVSNPSIGTPNPGFSIGQGASLAISNGKAASSSVLVNDLTGNPTQIYGALDASNVGGPLYVANASGIIVGPTGNITAPSAGIGLLAYQIPSAGYIGTVNIAKGTPGGNVSVQYGAVVKSHYILAAGVNSVNVSLGSASCVGGCSITAIAGGSFKTNPGSVKPVFPPPPKFHFPW